MAYDFNAPSYWLDRAKEKFSRGTAFHEAGHAVVAWSLGYTVQGVHVEAEFDSGHTKLAETEAQWRDDITILAAGYTAENLFKCWGPRPNSLHDLGSIGAVLGRNGIKAYGIKQYGLKRGRKIGPRQEAEARALAILKAHKDAIVRLVDALVESGRVDGEQFLRLMKDGAT